MKIIKEGRQHCLSDRHGRDMRSRLRHQETLHCALTGRVPIPAVDPYFEVDGHGYLPMAFVEGSDIGALDPIPFSSRPARERRMLLTRLRRACAAARQLHAYGEDALAEIAIAGQRGLRRVAPNAAAIAEVRERVQALLHGHRPRVINAAHR